MNKIDARMAIREEHQALYGVGLVLASYAGAVAVGGDGFLASFAAGVAVVVLNQSLCECFLDFGEIASEMAMLLAFVLFGAVLSGILGSVAVGPALILAVLVIFLIRPPVLALVLSRAKLSWEARAFVSWFGPRGLNSLLLALLVVQAGIPGSELLLATIGVVVLASGRSPFMEHRQPRLAHGTGEGPPARFLKRKRRLPSPDCLGSMPARYQESQWMNWPN